MWLSPFIAEMFIWAKWFLTGVLFEKASYMTVGEAGTQDILFWQGFLALVTMTCFHVLIHTVSPILKKWIKGSFIERVHT